MRAKHKKADGGRVSPANAPKDVYAGKDSEVVKDADKDNMKRGGVAKKAAKVEGEKARMRLDRPKRASGGRCGGSDLSPLSSAGKYD